VPRLSIVIPCVQDAEHFEYTLASVLQNRPDDCEVLVVQPRPYGDPYGLSGEVRFVEAPAGASLVDLINAGVRASAGAILHVLLCDMEVVDGWTDSVWPHFADPTVGTVSPLIVRRDQTRIVARGIGYGAGGRRKVLRRGPSRRVSTRDRLVGPTLLAGFYRRQAVLDVGGFFPGVGQYGADVDLGLALRRVGWRTIHAPQCVLIDTAGPATAPLSLRVGREAERLFWRNIPPGSWIPSLLLHAFAIAGELVTNAHRGGAVLQMLGRAMGLLEINAGLRHRRQLETLRAATWSSDEQGEQVFHFRSPRSPECEALRKSRAAA
jgi:hypothetical protein